MTLPADWRDPVGPSELAGIGTRWLPAGQHWRMRVPSIHVPTEFNYLLNPLYAEHNALKIMLYSHIRSIRV
jgi:hypothetical protein